MILDHIDETAIEKSMTALHLKLYFCAICKYLTLAVNINRLDKATLAKLVEIDNDFVN